MNDETKKNKLDAAWANLTCAVSDLVPQDIKAEEKDKLIKASRNGYLSHFEIQDIWDARKNDDLVVTDFTVCLSEILEIGGSIKAHLDNYGAEVLLARHLPVINCDGTEELGLSQYADLIFNVWPRDQDGFETYKIVITEIDDIEQEDIPVRFEY